MWMVKVVSFVYFCVHPCIPNDPAVKYFHIGYGVDWSTANESCGNLNGTLIRITDMEAITNITGEEIFTNFTFWSSITGLFSPWIAYRGCYPQQTVDKYISKWNINSVGNCYFQCKNQSSNPSDCTYFALGGDTCFCTCSTISSDMLVDSKNCNRTCNNSMDDGFCGGNGYVTLYEVNSYDGKGDGFCMAYSCGSIVLQSFGHDCDERHEGYCVDSHRTIHNQTTTTWNNYSVACKNQNLFLAASITKSPKCLGYAWIGIRRYEIHHGDNNFQDRDCYKIKRDLGTWLYEKTDCSKKLPFICKITNQHQSPDRTPGANIFENTANINTSSELTTSPQTESLVSSFHPFHPGTTITTVTIKLSVHTSDSSTTLIFPEIFQSPRNNTMGLVTGFVSGSIVLLITIAVVIYYVRRKQRSMNKTAKIVQNAIYGFADSEKATEREKDVIYMNIIAKNSNNSDANDLPKTDEVYMEKEEGEYDRLRTSRTKLCGIDEESYYDRSENTYSATARDRHICESHYDCMNSSEENQYDSKDIEHNKVYGSDYSSLAESTYGSSSSKYNIQESSHYDTTFQE